MRGLLDTLVKVSLIVAVALAATSVSYYYVIYLPGRDAAIEARRASERAAEIAEADRQQRLAEAERKRRAAEKETIEFVHKAGVQARYERCIANSESLYSVRWDGTCERVEEMRRKNYAQCMSNPVMGKPFCENTYGESSPSKNCRLPTGLAKDLGADLEQSRNRCFQEFQAGLE
jgi:hypothetical protein